MRPIATLKDVAKLANVSKMTVSRVINHPEQVTQELKDLVYKAMNELGYRPNTVAKALAQNRSLVIKVMILEEMNVTEPYYMKLITGIAKQLDHYQYALQLLTENAFDIGEADGYIVTGMKNQDFDWISKLDKPVIVFGENFHQVPFVDSNNLKGTYQATEYALQQGYDHIVYLGIDVPERFAQEREAGYCKALADLSKQAPHIYRLSNHSSHAAKLIEDHLEDFPPNTCFICASDRLAIGVERQLAQAGKEIPQDYGIIGFDGVFLDQIASPKLTTLKQPVVEMGQACVDQLMTLVDGKDLVQPQLYFDAQLITRGSTRN